MLSSQSWIVSPIYLFIFVRDSTRFTFSEGEALLVLADLHGGGDKSIKLVVLEYEEIRQQVKFSTTNKIFNCNIIPNPFFFWFLVGLLQAQ